MMKVKQSGERMGEKGVGVHLSSERTSSLMQWGATKHAQLVPATQSPELPGFSSCPWSSHWLSEPFDSLSVISFYFLKFQGLAFTCNQEP